MIKDMIMKLHEEANNEADHKAFCDTELGTNKQTREQKSSDVDELTAMVEENTAKMQQLQEEVERLMGEVSELDATMQKATEIRRAEKARNTAVVQDAKVAVPAVERATQVLKDFYEKASQATSFLQGSDPSKKSGPAGDAPETFGSTPFKGSSDSGGIIGMLEVILSDFQRLIAETEEEESMGLKEYEKLMAESTKDKAVKETNIEHKKTQNTDLQVKTQEAKKDLTSAHEELAAAMEYFERLKPSCVDEGLNYEEKVAKRKEEIQSLKEALQMLS
jgi:chromosome segregation ATPase